MKKKRIVATKSKQHILFEAFVKALLAQIIICESETSINACYPFLVFH